MYVIQNVCGKECGYLCKKNAISVTFEIRAGGSFTDNPYVDPGDSKTTKHWYETLEIIIPGLFLILYIILTMILSSI